MFEEHPAFRKPADNTVTIWRYQDMARLVSLLEYESLYFCRSDLLQDKFEGSLPRTNIERRNEESTKLLQDEDSFIKWYQLRTGTLLSVEQANNMMEASRKWVITNFSQVNLNAKRSMYINCWHANEHESAAMWSLYGLGGGGIAVKTTLSRLTNSFKSSQEPIHIGMIDYINYEDSIISEDNGFNVFLRKRLSFEHEHELRAIYWDNTLGFLDERPMVAGILINIDISELIENIVVSPLADEWVFDVVKSLANKYGFSDRVTKSILADVPYF